MKEKKALGTQRPQQIPKPVNQARNGVPWSTLEQQVVRMQKQISQACQHGDQKAVHCLQQQLIESEAARLLAVRRVAEEHQGKHTAGVDGGPALTAQERVAMASTIHPNNWKHQPPAPIRRVWVPKPGTGERRPLAILPMIDRCKQALVKLALEPEWEVRFEPHSYGFRPKRGTHDAIAALVVAIERHPTFVFNADIEKAFDQIDQAVILEKLGTYPALGEAIAAWLKAPVVDGGTFIPSEMGIPQGGALSPLLMNVTLHGMEAVVAQGAARESPLLVRYADNFVLLHADLKELQQAIKRVRRWLASMGLQLNAQKTRLTHTLTPSQGQVGFDFLGFHLHQERVEQRLPGRREREHAHGIKTIIIPSHEASKRHLATLEQRLQQLQAASQAQVIAELNPLITGWAAYYNRVVEASSMSQYDALVEQRLLSWASKRHPGQARDWLLNRYWQRVGNQRRHFATANGVQLRAYRQTNILRG